MDIPCQLFGESHKGLECITDFSPLSGIQGWCPTKLKIETEKL